MFWQGGSFVKCQFYFEAILPNERSNPHSVHFPPIFFFCRVFTWCTVNCKRWRKRKKKKQIIPSPVLDLKVAERLTSASAKDLLTTGSLHLNLTPPTGEKINHAEFARFSARSKKMAHRSISKSFFFFFPIPNCIWSLKVAFLQLWPRHRKHRDLS